MRSAQARAAASAFGSFLPISALADSIYVTANTLCAAKRPCPGGRAALGDAAGPRCFADKGARATKQRRSKAKVDPAGPPAAAAAVAESTRPPKNNILAAPPANAAVSGKAGTRVLLIVDGTWLATRTYYGA